MGEEQIPLSMNISEQLLEADRGIRELRMEI